MADESLLLLASEVRAKTLWILESVTDEQARFSGPAGLNNSILWHAGHALMVVEHLAVAPASGKPPVMPKGWTESFGWDSAPATVKHWPRAAEVAERLREQLGRLTRAVAALAPAQLDRVVDDPGNRTLRYTIVHGLHDEANHQGEMYLLWKIQGRRLALKTSTGS
jgi:DinB superfamily